jgi:hypothetical protein
MKGRVQAFRGPWGTGGGISAEQPGFLRESRATAGTVGRIGEAGSWQLLSWGAAGTATSGEVRKGGNPPLDSLTLQDLHHSLCSVIQTTTEWGN